MKYGAHSMIWSPKFREKELHLFEKVKDLGFDGIEICCGPQDVDSFPTDAISRKRQEMNMGVSLSTGLDSEHNISSLEQSRRKEGIEFLKWCINTATEIGADTISGVVYGPWIDFPHRPPFEEEMEACKDSLAEVAQLAESNGITLAVEPVNRFETNLVNKTEEAVSLVKDIDSPNLKLLLDTFHLNIEEDNIAEAFRTAGDLLHHVHACANHRGSPGEGHISWSEIYNVIEEIGYDRWFVIESFVFDYDLSQKTGIWKKHAQSPDELAKDGLDYLKSVEASVSRK